MYEYSMSATETALDVRGRSCHLWSIASGVICLHLRRCTNSQTPPPLVIQARVVWDYERLCFFVSLHLQRDHFPLPSREVHGWVIRRKRPLYCTGCGAPLLGLPQWPLSLYGLQTLPTCSSRGLHGWRIKHTPDVTRRPGPRPQMPCACASLLPLKSIINVQRPASSIQHPASRIQMVK